MLAPKNPKRHLEKWICIFNLEIPPHPCRNLRLKSNGVYMEIARTLELSRTIMYVESKASTAQREPPFQQAQHMGGPTLLRYRSMLMKKTVHDHIVETLPGQIRFSSNIEKGKVYDRIFLPPLRAQRFSKLHPSVLYVCGRALNRQVSEEVAHSGTDIQDRDSIQICDRVND